MMPLLIEPELLATLLNDSHVRILDVRFSLSDVGLGKRLYQQAHIPGAVYVDLEKDLSGAVVPGHTGRHPLPDPVQFLETMQAWGIQKTTHIIIYDDGSHTMAARAWWLLRWMGLTKVSVLHGGIKGWQANNCPMNADKPVFNRSDIQLQAGHMPVVDVQAVVDTLGSDNMKLVDARSEERFSGNNESIDARAGHIPGAVCHPFTQNTDEQGHFLPAEKLRVLLAPLLEGDGETIFYCGSGVTACHNILAMEYAGLGVGTLYPGSWSEWVADPSRPAEVSE